MDPVHINSGGSAYVDVAGNNWAPDTHVTGGTTGYGLSGVANTDDDPLYRAYRTGTATNHFTYTIPLSTPGSYTVTLKFNEHAKSAANQRKFDVSLEGSLVLDDFDIYAQAGGRNIALDRSFAVTVTDGVLNITFGRVVDNPIISAIEVVWAGSSPATPQVVYTYRGDGLCSTKTITTTPTITYTWDLNSSLPVVLQDGSQSYVYGLGGLISQTDITGTQSYFLSDGLGSIRKVTDIDGTVVADYYYDAFGAYRGSSFMYMSAPEYGFNGQQDDPTSGYLYLRARYYDPQSGRFLSKDPVRGTLTNPASQHYYGYAYNNPVNLTDPSGEIVPVIVAIAVGAWMAFEVASSAYDAYTTASTLLDPCASIEEKSITSGLFVIGLGLPGGGYATLGKGLKNLRTLKTGRLRGFARGNTELSGGNQKARELFKELAGREPSQSFDRVLLKDGREVVFRESSKSGPSKIEIADPGQKFYEKISFPE